MLKPEKRFITFWYVMRAYLSVGFSFSVFQSFLKERCWCCEHKNRLNCFNCFVTQPWQLLSCCSFFKKIWDCSLRQCVAYKNQKTCCGLRNITFILKIISKYRQPIFHITITGTKKKQSTYLQLWFQQPFAVFYWWFHFWRFWWGNTLVQDPRSFFRYSANDDGKFFS